jgi:acyl carrier protein
VGVHDSFFELGGDSVLAAQILSLAQRNFGIRINPQDAFKAFTIEKLAEMLEAEIMSRIEEMSEEEARQLLSKNT